MNGLPRKGVVVTPTCVLLLDDVCILRVPKELPEVGDVLMLCAPPDDGRHVAVQHLNEGKMLPVDLAMLADVPVFDLHEAESAPIEVRPYGQYERRRK